MGSAGLTDKLSRMNETIILPESIKRSETPALPIAGVGHCALSEVYLVDCVQGLRYYPDNYFDLAVVDPPYGIGLVKTEAGNWGIRKEKKESIKKNSDWDFAKPTKEYIVELFRVSKNQIMWGANNYIDVVPYNSSCWLVWDKVNGGSYFADCELAWTSFETATRKITKQWFGANSHREGKRIHNTQKPVGLYEWIFKKYAEKGFRILDTHLGSGSSRIAANKAGLDFVGFEINEDIYMAQEKRWQNWVSQTRLF
jgi:site-specific DNA-methyltransferase (adenine-specific)